MTILFSTIYYLKFQLKKIFVGGVRTSWMPPPPLLPLLQKTLHSCGTSGKNNYLTAINRTVVHEPLLPQAGVHFISNILEQAITEVFYNSVDVMAHLGDRGMYNGIIQTIKIEFM